MLPVMHRSHQYRLTTWPTGFLIPLGFCCVLVTLALAGGACRFAAAQEAQPKPEAPKQMSPCADPSYEVATIKPSNPNRHNDIDGFRQSGRRLDIEYQTLNNMLNFAYGVHPRQIVDAPAWFATDRYDVEGVLDTEGEPNLKQEQGIVKKLLADRFQLKFHRETRGLSVYALTMTGDGPKLNKSKGDPNAQGDEKGNMRAGQSTMTITNMSMADFALIMQFYTDRPVVDQTGLAGKWDFKWTWTSDESRVSPESNAAPGLFTAIQEQLGLKLEAKKAPAEVFVVDHVERPSAN